MPLTGARHSGRQAALQVLFQIEASGADADRALRLFWRSFGEAADPEGRGYAEELVRGVDQCRAELDRHLATASANWRVERMTGVDRNVLRIGVWELVHQPAVPRAVILDEAVELAKAFGTQESGAFVNGVLNRIADLVGRGDPTAT